MNSGDTDSLFLNIEEFIKNHVGLIKWNSLSDNQRIDYSIKISKLIEKYVNEKLSGVIVIDFTLEKATKVIQSNSVVSKPNAWQFNDGKIYTVSNDGKITNTSSFRSITLEDPIEFLFKDEKSIISQREIPNDMDSYQQALKYILRQDPDIIFIGELRDVETVEAAIKASETGHLVISTLHTVDASQTITRIVDFFPTEHQKQIRYQLAKNLKAVVSQRLLPSKDRTKRYAAVEVMVQTPTISELILSPEGVKEIPETIKVGKEIYGMQTFDQSIGQLYTEGKITYNTAIEAATLKKDIELLKRGISYESTNELYKGMLDF